MDSLMQILVTLIGGASALFLYSKIRNNNTLSNNEKKVQEVQKIEGKVEQIDESVQQKDKQIDQIQQETKNEIEKKQTLEQLSSFFNSMFK